MAAATSWTLWAVYALITWALTAMFLVVFLLYGAILIYACLANGVYAIIEGHFHHGGTALLFGIGAGLGSAALFYLSWYLPVRRTLPAHRSRWIVAAYLMGSMAIAIGIVTDREDLAVAAAILPVTLALWHLIAMAFMWATPWGRGDRVNTGVEN